MRRDPATYTPYISPARVIARGIRNDARYQALQEAGVCSESLQGLQGLPDAEYCYLLRMGNLMPSNKKEIEHE